VCLLSLLSLTKNITQPDIIEKLKANNLGGKYEGSI